MEPTLPRRSLVSHLRPSTGRALHGFGAARSVVLSLSRIIFAALAASPTAAAPASYFNRQAQSLFEHNDGDDPDSGTSLWVLYLASAVLVLLGGAFAGLTIALMGQDSIYLQVLSRDETDPQQGNARRVYNLLQRGKHWVLVTLLLSNVIVNETLPVVLDRCLGGGVAAVVGSTVLIVIFGEVLPQSICVRYGLQIGGIMSKPVLALMWLMAPIAWPTAKVLDHALGEDHGTVYKKSGLKTLVTLHRSLGEVSERLNQDEVTIISAVLDLKGKPVSNVMTPMDDVFTMSEDTILDEKMMDMILSAGYSRIPIHEHGNATNFVGMLLVKILITYDPDDKMRVNEFPLATLPETRPETSCLDIVNFFQEGKSHMVLVSQYPGEDHGALGVVTLEDVIEELIGEEIIDESDVYIDVHKAIRRLQPAPRSRPIRQHSLASNMAVSTALVDGSRVVVEEEGDSSTMPGHLPQHANLTADGLSRADAQGLSTSPKTATFMMRRCSTGADGRMTSSAVPVRANIDEMWQHLRHLGPSNPASNPKNTRSTTVKIKTGIAQTRSSLNHGDVATHAVHETENENEEHAANEATETTHLLNPNMSTCGNDGTSSPRQSYGTRTAASDSSTAVTGRNKDDDFLAITSDAVSTQVDNTVVLRTEGSGDGGRGNPVIANDAGVRRSGSESAGSGASVIVSVSEHGTVTAQRPFVRSGSITENVIETRGIRKVVLETTSSAEEDSEAAGSNHGERRHLPHEICSPAITEEERSRSGDECTGKPSDTAGSSHQDVIHQPGGGTSGATKKKNRRRKRKGAKA